MRTKKKFILSWSFAAPAARTIRPTSDPIQPVLRRSWVGAGAPLGVPSAPRLNAFAFRGELAGCNSWPRFNASASSRHALASLSIKARCLGSSAFAAAAEAFLRLIFIHLSQSWHGNPLNTVPLITWYQDAAFRFVIHPTNERKNFWFAQESWAAADLTSPPQARAAWVQQQSCAYGRNTIVGPLGTGTPRGDLSGCVRPGSLPSLVQRRTWEARFMHMFPRPFPLV